MNILTRIFKWLYTQSLKLYPSKFRADFGDEMQDVFTQAMNERTADGKALIIFWRELKGLPGSLLYQHSAAIKKEKISMTAISSSNNVQPQVVERQPGTWGAAFLAGLPHLLMGLLIGLGKLAGIYVYEASQTSSVIIGIALALFVAAMLILAWRRGWPLWSASWYFYGTWVLLIVIGLTIDRLNLEDSWRYTNALFLGWILLCIIGYFAILLKSKLHGLLSVAFLFPMLSAISMEFIPDPIEGWFAIGVSLLVALSAGAIVRSGDFRVALGWVLGVNLAVGLVWAYISEYKMFDLPNGMAHTPKFGNFLGFLGFYSILSLGVVALPFILRGLWNFGRRKLQT